MFFKGSGSFLGICKTVPCEIEICHTYSTRRSGLEGSLIFLIQWLGEYENYETASLLFSLQENSKLRAS